MIALDDDKPIWCIVEHRGFGRNHSAVPIRLNMTKKEATELSYKMSAAAREHRRRRRMLVVQRFRPDGQYQLF